MEQELANALHQLHRNLVDELTVVIDERVDRAFGALHNEMLTNFDAVFKRLERLEQEDQMQLEAMRRMEGRLTNVEHGLVEVRHDIAELRKERA